MGDELFQGKGGGGIGTSNPSELQVITIKGRDAQEMYPPKMTFNQSKSLGNGMECSCDIVVGNNSKFEYMHNLSCKNVQTTTC